MFKGFTGIIAYPITENELVIEDSDELNQGQQPGICGTVLQNTVYAKGHQRLRSLTTMGKESGTTEVQDEGKRKYNG